MKEGSWKQNCVCVYSQILYVENKGGAGQGETLQLNWCKVFVMETENLGEKAQSSQFYVTEEMITQSLVEDGKLPPLLSKVLYCSQKHFGVDGFQINTRAWS